VQWFLTFSLGPLAVDSRAELAKERPPITRGGDLCSRRLYAGGTGLFEIPRYGGDGRPLL
jgi:hypothetical protein